MIVYSKVRLGLSPEINALATLLVGAVALGMLAAALVMARTTLHAQRQDRHSE